MSFPQISHTATCQSRGASERCDFNQIVNLLKIKYIMFKIRASPSYCNAVCGDRMVVGFTTAFRTPLTRLVKKNANVHVCNILFKELCFQHFMQFLAK